MQQIPILGQPEAEPGPQDAPSQAVDPREADLPAPSEHGGRVGPDPTRYGDWEKNGRCIDF